MTHPFITHNGGPCPVSPETMVDVEFRDGTSVKGLMAVWPPPPADWWEWAGKRRAKKLMKNDIVAYRLHHPDTQPTEV